MNFLEMCQRLHREMRDSGTGLTAVTNQKGRALETVEAIREAWTEIQSSKSWDTSFWGLKSGSTTEYYSQYDPQVLATEFETPFIPAQYHLAIVWKAMIGTAIRMNAAEMVTKAQENYDTLMAQVVNRYVGPNFGVPDAVVSEDITLW